MSLILSGTISGLASSINFPLFYCVKFRIIADVKLDVAVDTSFLPHITANFPLGKLRSSFQFRQLLQKHNEIDEKLYQYHPLSLGELIPDVCESSLSSQILFEMFSAIFYLACKNQCYKFLFLAIKHFCSHKGDTLNTEVVQEIYGKIRSSEKIYLDDIPKHRICRRTGSSQSEYHRFY